MTRPIPLRGGGPRRGLVLAGLLAVVAGCAIAPSGPPATPPPPAAEVDGPFRLELALPRTDWRAGEAITGTATLSYAGAAPTTVYGSGVGVIAFSYAEVGGTRRVDPAWTADCTPHPIGPAAPITAELSKSGAVGGTEPDADFLRSFLTTDPGVVRLPAGTWDVSAVTMFL
ncbi:MAG TPA: hypothetical protein VIH37_05400, partial [Candidatus Limnocylindrales bacterium]